MNTRKLSLRYFLLISCASLLVAASYYYFVDTLNKQYRISNYEDFIKNSPSSWMRNQGNYRILAPFAAYPLINLFSRIIGYDRAFPLVWAVFEFGSIMFFFIVFFIYIREWFSESDSFIMVLFSALAWIFSFRNQDFAPWSLIEPGIFALGLLLIKNNKFI